MQIHALLFDTGSEKQPLLFYLSVLLPRFNVSELWLFSLLVCCYRLPISQLEIVAASSEHERRRVDHARERKKLSKAHWKAASLAPMHQSRHKLRAEAVACGVARACGIASLMGITYHARQRKITSLIARDAVAAASGSLKRARHATKRAGLQAGGDDWGGRQEKPP